MNESQNNAEVTADLPKANVKKNGRYFSIVWIVPVIAAILAAYLVYGQLQQSGPKITISFKDGSGLRTGQTPIKYRGVQIGEVTAVELSQDHQAVLVKARLQRSAASIASEGSVFWIVRPEVGIGTSLAWAPSLPDRKLTCYRAPAKRNRNLSAWKMRLWHYKKRD